MIEMKLPRLNSAAANVAAHPIAGHDEIEVDEADRGVPLTTSPQSGLQSFPHSKGIRI